MQIVAGYELNWAAKQYQDDTAVLVGEARLNYRALDERINRLANGLRNSGAGNGTRVASLLHNRLEAVEIFLAAKKGGFVHVALNARHTVSENAVILRDCAASVLIVGPEFRDCTMELRDEVPSLITIVQVGHAGPDTLNYEGLLAQGSMEAPRVTLDDSAPSSIAYTSGTTGNPKGVVYSYSQYHQRLNNFFTALEYGLEVGDSMVHVGPLSHASGNYLLPYYLRGACNIVMRGFNEAGLLELIETERVTHLFLVPVMISRLLNFLEDSKRDYDLSSLKRINYGTSAIPCNELRRAIARFGPIFRQHLGMTECPQPLTVLYPHEHIVEGTEKMRRRLSSCGRPTLNINISIRDEHDAECPLGEVGTIALSAHGIADVRYWNRPDLRRKIEETGLFHTGDRGWMDEDGYLFIVGRSADVINSGGFNVYAFEVEETLQHHAQVAEAAVIGVPDPDWGESVLAWVVPRSLSWPSAEELIEHCRAHIASYKKPREIRYIESLPRSPTGKVDKEALRALWAVQQEGHANTRPNRQGGNDA